MIFKKQVLTNVFRLEEGEGFCGKINVQKSLKLKDVEGR